jgi:hypothetical protein
MMPVGTRIPLRGRRWERRTPTVACQASFCHSDNGTVGHRLLSVMVVFGDLATIVQGANGAADLAGPPCVLFGESGILADEEARWLSSPPPQRSAVGPLRRILVGAWNQSSGAVARGRHPGSSGRTVANAAPRGPAPRGTSGRKRPDRAARLSVGPKSAPAHLARS